MEEKAIVEVTVGMDEESYRHFYWFVFFHWPQRPLSFLVLSSLFPLVTIPLYLRFGPSVTGDPLEKPILLSLLLLCALGISLVYLFHLPQLQWEKLRKTQPQPKPYTFTFFEEQMQWQCDGQNVSGTLQIQYEKYSRIYENQHAFYLVHEKNCIALSKKYFSEAEAAALRELFARQFGETFKTKGA